MQISPRVLNVLSVAGLALLGVLFTMALASRPSPAAASPMTFCRDAFAVASTTVAATSTTNQKYFSPGAGTSTLTTTNCYDRSIALNRLVLALQLTASTSKSFNFRLEGSYDGIDWYSISAPLVVSGTIATTTQITGNYLEYSINSATSTANTGASGSLATVNTSIELPVMMPYERVVFYSPVGGANAGLYAELIGRREIGGK